MKTKEEIQSLLSYHKGYLEAMSKQEPLDTVEYNYVRGWVDALTEALSIVQINKSRLDHIKAMDKEDVALQLVSAEGCICVHRGNDAICKSCPKVLDKVKWLDEVLHLEDK